MMTMEVLDMLRSCNFIKIPSFDFEDEIGIKLLSQRILYFRLPNNAINVHVIYQTYIIELPCLLKVKMFHQLSKPKVELGCQNHLKHLQVIVVF
jgi:hypothetical protein